MIPLCLLMFSLSLLRVLLLALMHIYIYVQFFSSLCVRK